MSTCLRRIQPGRCEISPQTEDLDLSAIYPGASLPFFLDAQAVAKKAWKEYGLLVGRGSSSEHLPGHTFEASHLS